MAKNIPHGMKRCARCGGNGKMADTSPKGKRSWIQKWTACDGCGGTGYRKKFWT